MKNEKLELLLNKVVEYNKPNVINCKGFLYSDLRGYYIKVVECTVGNLPLKQKIWLNEDDEQFVSHAEKPKLMKVKKDSSHYKLVKYVLGDKAPTPKTMQNGCPYFWLLLFSIITVVFVVLWRSFVWLLSLIPEVMIWGLEKLTKNWVADIDDGHAYDIFYSGYSGKRLPITAKMYLNQADVDNDEFLDYFLLEKYNIDKKVSPEEYKIKKQEMSEKWMTWRNELAVLRDEQQKANSARRNEQRRKRMKREHLEELRREKWEARMKPINKAFKKLGKGICETFTFNYDWRNIIKRTKQVVGAVITVVLLGVSYVTVNVFALALMAFIDFCITHWYLFAIIGIAGIIGVIVYVLYILITGWVQGIVIKYNRGKRVWYIESLIYLLYYPTKYVIIALAYALLYMVWIPIKYILWVFLWKLILVNLIKLIWKGLCSLGRSLANSTGVFGEYFGASYSDYCPGIEWEGFDEDGK